MNIKTLTRLKIAESLKESMKQLQDNIYHNNYWTWFWHQTEKVSAEIKSTEWEKYLPTTDIMRGYSLENTTL